MNIVNSIYQKDLSLTTPPGRMYPFRFINPAVSANKRYLSDLRALNEANNHDSLPSRPWCCYKDRDFCPLVICLMTFVIVISFLLIVYYCTTSAFKSKRLRRAFRRFKSKLTGQPCQESEADSDEDEDVDFEQLQAEMQRQVSRLWMRHNLNPATLISIADISQTPHADSGASREVWFTDLSKYPMAPPPPSYDASQLMAVQPSSRSKFINSPDLPIVNPVAATASVNGAFSMETASPCTVTATAESSGPIFPQYRCITLSTNPRSQLSTVRTQLSQISGRLEQENRSAYPTTTSFNYFQHKRRSNTLVIGGMDEVPPAYETVIKHQGQAF